MINRGRKVSFISSILGLLLIGIFSLEYSMFYKRFAELHITLSFIDFPIFIGESLILTCIVLLFMKSKSEPVIIRNPGFVITIYFIFVLIKALLGYCKFGPLALRHAALFYYPIFAVFGCLFYNKSFFSQKNNIFLALIMIIALRFCYVYEFYLLSFILLILLLSLSCSKNILRYSLFALLLIFIPYKPLFATSRMMLIGNIFAFLYIGLCLFIYLKIKTKFKIAYLITIFIMLIIGFWRFGDRNAIKSITDIKKIRELYREYSQQIVDKQDSFIMEPFEVRLYNPEAQLVLRQKPKEELPAKIEPQKPSSSSKPLPEPSRESIALIQTISAEKPKEELPAKIEPQKPSSSSKPLPEPSRESIALIQTISAEKPKEELPAKIEPQKPSSSSKLPLSEDKIISKRIVAFKSSEYQAELKTGSPFSSFIQLDEAESVVPRREIYRDLSQAHHNTLFRVFIWRDILEKLTKDRPIFGFPFGLPFRSKSLEILGWGSVAYERDGWIAVHNSYLDIIYRAGLIGILFIILILFILFRLIYLSIKLRNIYGIMLTAIIINWLIAANFLEILELPYTAIPLWSLFGMTYTYLTQKEGYLK